ncbi:glycosyltransferase family 2 protein [Frigoriflavimonas asaccharolytica]|uniref:Glycosyltransferase involved in cell wall biosynthesis n=1 Tax=Frigoriflavimonas asaccharolytica TaxID=2735899 RepID=A0A8J8KBK5_9FLAO|nr:glycosyltransferase [Frigoriflavimonas asaccharolytica]NRS92674.1 glycosyltransferase involved in cell wall biosynthesis [Frigoriflavimonas asaccharolytica]
MEQPLVSVVVVSYNQSRYIVEMLDSLKNQTYTNWELIVADDKSQDNSTEIFENWLTEHNVNAQKIFHETNTGLATTLNDCVEHCTGKYIKLIAADDFLHPDCLAESVQILEEKGKNYGMVFTDTFCIDDQSKLLPNIADYNALGGIPSENFRKVLIKGNRIAALTVMMRTDVLKETGKYDSNFIVEDYYRWLKINEKYLIAYIPKKLTYYRCHDTNISGLRAGKIAEETVILQMMFDKDGMAKTQIDNYFYKAYFQNTPISRKVIDDYYCYPFKNRRLQLSLKYKIPIVFYKLISKVV